MKIRLGFVSNSSSSSFVVSLCDIPINSMDYFIEMVNRHNNESSEGYLYIGKRYVHGMICMHNEEIINFLRHNNVYYENDI